MGPKVVADVRNVVANADASRGRCGLKSWLMWSHAVDNVDPSRGKCGPKSWPMLSTTWPMRIQVVTDVDRWPIWNSLWPMGIRVAANVGKDEDDVAGQGPVGSAVPKVHVNHAVN